jgi:hypothetical protein
MAWERRCRVGGVRTTRQGERGRGAALAGGLPGERAQWQRERKGERVKDGAGYSAISLN